MKTVLVIGGGITGLSTMFELQKWKKATKANVQLVLADASDRLGGKIRSEKADEFIMESGADSIVSRKLRGLSIIEELGLENEITYNATGRSFIYSNEELKLIPVDSIFGIPASIESLANSTLISAEGKVAALKDFYTNDRTFTPQDSIGEFLEYYLGKEIVEKQIAPVLSGVYSGKLSELSIASTLPYLLDYKKEYGSIMKGLQANLKDFQSDDDKKFLSFKDGLSSIVEAYEKQLDEVTILKNATASKLEKANRYKVSFTNGETIEADYVVLSIPHTAAQNLLEERSLELEEEFEQLKNGSLISIYLGFDIPDELLPEEGTGFIAANDQQLSSNACTWTSRKWTHTSTNGNLLVRLFYKSSHPSFAALKKMNDDGLIEVALEDIEKSLGITAKPTTSLVTNWSDDMPSYQINHQQIVRNIEEKLKASYPKMLIAGCSYYGVGIPDCIENGIETASKVVAKFEESNE